MDICLGIIILYLQIRIFQINISLTDTGENVQKWTRVFSTRRKKVKKIACPLLDVFACGQVSSLRLYRLRVNYILYQLFNTNSAIFQALNKIEDFEAGLRQTTNQLNQKEEHLEDIFNKVKVQG